MKVGCTCPTLAINIQSISQIFSIARMAKPSAQETFANRESLTMEQTPVEIRQATPRDEAEILALVPRLVEFGVPSWRDAQQMTEVDRSKIREVLSERRSRSRRLRRRQRRRLHSPSFAGGPLCGCPAWPCIGPNRSSAARRKGYWPQTAGSRRRMGECARLPLADDIGVSRQWPGEGDV